MPLKIPSIPGIEPLSSFIYLLYTSIVVLAIGAYAITSSPFPLLLPAAFLIVYVAILDFRKLYFLLLICIPFSTEVYLPNGLGTDLPTEPLIVGLMLVYIMYFIQNVRKINSTFFRHTLMLFLFLHLGWMLIAVFNSQLLVVSIKFFLAKLWYVVTFVFLTGLIVKSEREFKQLFWSVFIPLIITVLYVLYRQGVFGFSLEMVGKAMHPFYRNHVNYAALLTLFLPIVITASTWYKRWSIRWWAIICGGLILLIAIQLAFTRSAYVSLMLAFVAYFIIRYRLMKGAISLAIVVVLAFATYVATNNRYLDYAPNFEKTITHHNMEDLFKATYNMEDLSTMERLYRWVAGVHMSSDQRLFGFGPGNFYNFYKKYTVRSFETYVSDNKDKSGVHNYYLMVLIDQGIPGCLIFLLLTAIILVVGERIYHRTDNVERKGIIMSLLLSMIIIDAFLIINDLLETDKVGAFYFIHIAVLINFDLLNTKKPTLKVEEAKET